MTQSNSETKDAFASDVDALVMAQSTLDLCSDYDIGCRIDEKNDMQVCENCFYGIGFEDSPHWNGADGYCPILRKAP